MDADEINEKINGFSYPRLSAAKIFYSVISVVNLLFLSAFHHRYVAGFWWSVNVRNGQTHLFTDRRWVGYSGCWRFAGFEALFELLGTRNAGYRRLADGHIDCV